MSVSSRIAYHLDELETAQDPLADDHIMPTVLPADKAILDVGCGIGQTLVSLGVSSLDAAGLNPIGLDWISHGSHVSDDRLLVGIDIEHESLVFGQERFSSVGYVNSTAEVLPFAENTFDLVISRVALPYTNIPQALAEMYRVVKPGGRVWITLHPKRKTFNQLMSALKEFRIKDIIFRTYILTNGLYFHVFGNVFDFPFNQKTESFQTTKSITKALHASGFTELVVTRDRHFLATGSRAHFKGVTEGDKPHSVQQRPSQLAPEALPQELPQN